MYHFGLHTAAPMHFTSLHTGLRHFPSKTAMTRAPVSIPSGRRNRVALRSSLETGYRGPFTGQIMSSFIATIVRYVIPGQLRIVGAEEVRSYIIGLSTHLFPDSHS